MANSYDNINLREIGKTISGIFAGLGAAGIIGCSSPTVNDYFVDRSAYSITSNNSIGFTNPNDSLRSFTLGLNRTYWDQGPRAEVLVSGRPDTLMIGNTIELVLGAEPKISYRTYNNMAGVERPWITLDRITGERTESAEDDTIFVEFNVPHRLPRNLMR